MLTDAFSHKERGMALGINGVAFAGGSVAGLVIGGLASIDWHLDIPDKRSRRSCRRGLGLHRPSRDRRSQEGGWSIDIIGNVLLALALTVILVSLTYAFLPSGNSPTGWTNPITYGGITAGIIIIALFVLVELRSKDPMLDVRLFKNKTFASANLSGFLGGMARGGLQFMLIIWLQGIWLPLHGVEFIHTPLLAAIYMLPLTIGFLIFGPISGKLSDKYGQRWFMTAGMILNVIGFLALSFLPVEFALLPFRTDNLSYRGGTGPLQLAKFHEHNEYSTAAPEGCCRRDAGHILQYVLHVQHHNILHPPDNRFGLIPSKCLYAVGLVAQGVPPAAALNISHIPPTAALLRHSWAITPSSR